VEGFLGGFDDILMLFGSVGLAYGLFAAVLRKVLFLFTLRLRGIHFLLVDHPFMMTVYDHDFLTEIVSDTLDTVT
jgi:uncharacterized membrane protein YhfC